MAKVSRIIGNYAAIKIGSIVVADAYEWSLKAPTSFLEHRAFGDICMQREFDGIDFEVTMKKYCRNGGLGAFMGAAAAGAVDNGVTPPASAIVHLYQNSTIEVFTCEMWVDSPDISFAHGKLVEENVTFKCSTAPTFVLEGLLSL